MTTSRRRLVGKQSIRSRNEPEAPVPHLAQTTDKYQMSTLRNGLLGKQSGKPGKEPKDVPIPNLTLTTDVCWSPQLSKKKRKYDRMIAKTKASLEDVKAKEENKQTLLKLVNSLQDTAAELLKYQRLMERICPENLQNDRYVQQNEAKYLSRMTDLVASISKHEVVKKATTFIRILDYHERKIGKVLGGRSRGKQKEGMTRGV